MTPRQFIVAYLIGLLISVLTAAALTDPPTPLLSDHLVVDTCEPAQVPLNQFHIRFRVWP